MSSVTSSHLPFPVVRHASIDHHYAPPRPAGILPALLTPRAPGALPTSAPTCCATPRPAPRNPSLRRRSPQSLPLILLLLQLSPASEPRTHCLANSDRRAGVPDQQDWQSRCTRELRCSSEDAFLLAFIPSRNALRPTLGTASSSLLPGRAKQEPPTMLAPRNTAQDPRGHSSFTPPSRRAPSWQETDAGSCATS